MRFGSTDWEGEHREAPAWTQVPGFDLSLQRLEPGRTITYSLAPQRIERGFWISPEAVHTVVRAREGERTRQFLRTDNETWFCYHSQEKDLPHWFVRVPGGLLHDGSSVSIARWWTGSGLSRPLLPAGALHDYLTRQWTKDWKQIEIHPSYPIDEEAKPIRRRTTLRELALIWGAAVDSLTARPRWHVRLFERALALVHPLHVLMTPGFRWEETQQ